MDSVPDRPPVIEGLMKLPLKELGPPWPPLRRCAAAMVEASDARRRGVVAVREETCAYTGDFSTPRLSAGLRLVIWERSCGPSVLVGPPRAYTPVYVLCRRHAGKIEGLYGGRKPVPGWGELLASRVQVERMCVRAGSRVRCAPCRRAAAHCQHAQSCG